MLINLKNRQIIDLNMPEVEIIGNNFLCLNDTLITFSACCLKEVRHNFLSSAGCLTNFYVPNLEIAGDAFIAHDKGLLTPVLKQVGLYFLHYNTSLTSFYAPILKIRRGASNWGFLRYNKNIDIYQCYAD
jgi:hypothetical protein